MMQINCLLESDEFETVVHGLLPDQIKRLNTKLNDITFNHINYRQISAEIDFLTRIRSKLITTATVINK